MPPSFKILIFLDLALIIPAVTVELRLYGLPTASTHSPTLSSFELSKCIKFKSRSSIFSKAKSLFESSPKIFAL